MDRALISGEAKIQQVGHHATRLREHLGCAQSRTSEGLDHRPRRKLATRFDAMAVGLRCLCTSRAQALEHRPGIRSPLRRPCDLYARTYRAECRRGSPANDAHPEERRWQRARVEPVGAGAVATTSSALVRPAAGFRVPAGPETSNAAPSGARRQARGTERVISPAHLRWALRGIPAEVGVEETACGLGPGRSPPPTEPSIRFDGSAHNLSHPGAIAVQDIQFIPLS